MSNKYHTACNFRNSRAAKKMAANYRKTFGLGLDGKPRRYGKRNKTPKRTRKPNTWGSIYRNALKRGDDHGYAAYLADQWEKRQAKRLKK